MPRVSAAEGDGEARAVHVGIPSPQAKAQPGAIHDVGIHDVGILYVAIHCEAILSMRGHDAWKARIAGRPGVGVMARGWESGR